ncbi:Hypothetical_protein [Hexamita inflata]|uniref:Hypothetical_protein n=1 Tax=Hexamita inflata TaxID=28002 RepID=A0AA86RGT1_9EUKA|nr:Hypothetical protein HINF_LOCUS61571 [Hexamita inflata]CAI9973928.1 Hypothetical protein HINF_LOCUS61573 [Hexamita inflata]
MKIDPFRCTVKQQPDYFDARYFTQKFKRLTINLLLYHLSILKNIQLLQIDITLSGYIWRNKLRIHLLGQHEDHSDITLSVVKTNIALHLMLPCEHELQCSKHQNYCWYENELSRIGTTYPLCYFVYLHLRLCSQLCQMILFSNIILSKLISNQHY